MLEIILSAILGLNSITQDIDIKSNNLNQPAVNYQLIKENSTQPYLLGQAGLVADMNTNQILFQKNASTQLPIASLTKIMTSLIILNEHSLDELVTIPSQASTVGGSMIFLKTGQQLDIHSLLKALLIESSNDAAIALAIHNAGSVDDFVTKMNQKTIELDLQNTSFANPMGFDDPNNYSTVHDLLKLAKELYANPVAREIVNTKKSTIADSAGNTYKLTSTNLILNNYLNVTGLKTGSTDLAGGCFIGVSEGEIPIISIILGSNDRFLDSKTMLDWAKQNYKIKYF
jgi:D-alanyl-D-alanine carboxypeptidase (penicillin-binding protein 5/6)